MAGSALLGLLLFLLPFGPEAWEWGPGALLGLLLGGLAGPAIEMSTHGVRGRGRRFILAYVTLTIPSALVLPLMIFGGGLLEAATAQPKAFGALLVAVLALVAATHAAYVLHRAGNPPAPDAETHDESIPLRWLWLAGGVATLLLVGWFSYRQPENVSLHFLYLAPTSLVAWATGRWGGMAMAIVAMNTHTFTLAIRVPEPPMSDPWLALDVYILLGGLFIGANLVGALRGKLNEEASAARHDPLTGLPNRRGFMEQAVLELGRSVRYGTPVALAYIDVDNFKSVNDVEGHAVGDELLRAVGQTLRFRTRENDIVARFGGDEFAVLLPSTDASEAMAVLEGLRDRLDVAMARESWPVSFSIGAVAGVPGSSDPALLMDAADALMYLVKNSGKNGLRVEPLPSRSESALGSPAGSA